MVETIEEQIVLIHVCKNQYDYVQGMLAAAGAGSLITISERTRLHNAAKDALAGFANELDFYADAMLRRAENDKEFEKLFDTTPAPGYSAPPCPTFDLLQRRKANQLVVV